MKIGVFDAGLPNCSHDAGSSAIVELCALVQSMGHDTQYLYTGDNPWGRTTDLTDNNIIFNQVTPSSTASKFNFKARPCRAVDAGMQTG